ncbi:MAG: tRNA preQ1(34) S-adenosylmethionine ribosyltransferase-isomerase QueA [Acidobacteria bacterium]|nr:tRNA preQ1(34) S-adenosylmethionine ribosyltransferase-isomerase QueA [Acidobacteriota bacterium]
MLQLSDHDFELPNELIADQPLEDRSASRMMVVDRAGATFNDRTFSELPDILRSGDLLVLNNTKVFPARLFGKTQTGANIEIFLIEPIGDRSWKALARPGKRLKIGTDLRIGEDLVASVKEKFEDGIIIFEFSYEGDFFELLGKYGKTPLPPYIKRQKEAPDADRERYQTVYAKDRGAIAAPTAGLHFTDEIFTALKDKNIEIAEITLHVGYGTFEPIRVDDLADHRVMPERFSISAETAEHLNAAKQDGRRVIAVGTTTTRTLEYLRSKSDLFHAGSGLADLTILPGHRFLAINGLLTNFHLPKSSLLVLVSAFAGNELIMNAYRNAVEEKYRFYSYGDCMLIL